MSVTNRNTQWLMRARPVHSENVSNAEICTNKCIIKTLGGLGAFLWCVLVSMSMFLTVIYIAVQKNVAHDAFRASMNTGALPRR